MLTAPEPFRLGVNYWPAAQAMDWLADYDAAGTRRDFCRIGEAGFDSIRIFVRWADMQPGAQSIDGAVLARVVDAADAAIDAGVELIVTLFVGHMSGVNWIPAWATGGADGDPRFRVVAPGAPPGPGRTLRNWYSDPELVAAQEHQAGTVAAALSGHPGVWMWDLGNENSNCTVPPDAAAGEAWLDRMTSALRRSDPGRPITTGLHAEDLDDDRRIGPAEVARYCDVVSMHGYPAYTAWANGPTDDRLLPFLALVTRWLAGGAGVLFEEFGLPTGESGRIGPGALVPEGDAAAYTGRALDGLRQSGCPGALLWCYSDYPPALHTRPPFDDAPHERTFGLWRADGSPKPAVAEVTARAGREQLPVPDDPPWIDLSAEEFAVDRRRHLARLYQQYSRHQQLSPA